MQYETVLQIQHSLTTILMSRSGSCWFALALAVGTSVQHMNAATSVELTQLFRSVVMFKCLEENDVIHFFPTSCQSFLAIYDQDFDLDIVPCAADLSCFFFSFSFLYFFLL